MRRLTLLLLLVGLALAACSSSESDKQWYKPNVDYTTAEFELDRAACTDKKKILDEDCMKKHGWVALGGDIGPAIKAPAVPERPKGAKY